MRKLGNVRSLHVSTLALAFVGLLSSASQAATAPVHFQKRAAGLEVFSGSPSRAQVQVSASVGPRAAAAWVKFQQEVGGQWQAIWDRDTGVPLRIFGSGISAPASVSDPLRAERHARDLLARHIGLLAPGSQARDLVLVSNQLHNGVRTVGFQQEKNGYRVIGGQVSFRFKADRMVAMGSEALPFAQQRSEREADDTALAKRARKWILSDSASLATTGAIEGPFILPIVRSGRVDYHTVMRVTVDGEKPIGRWQVYLDAASADPVAREQTLHFADANIAFDVPIREPLTGRATYPAKDLTVIVNGVEQTSTNTGDISWAGQGSAIVKLSVQGPQASVMSEVGNAASVTLPVSSGSAQVWTEQDSRMEAQLAGFIHSRIAKERARELNPNLSWLDTQLPVRVNIDDACNAYSDGNSINFFLESSQCANTALLADVVYHEFGHSLHSNSIIDGVGGFDGAMSEGLSDFFAATITEDPAMGVGFFKSAAPLRHIDPASREHVWPDDVGEIHYTGLIFAGAMWDLRKILIEKHGEEEGRILTDRLFYATLQRATNIPATYVEVLVEDDDDGDLSNGTPNLCDINAVFGQHGLRVVDAHAGNLSVVSPELDGYDIDITVKGLSAQCPGDLISSATINWQLRDDSTKMGEQAMTENENVYSGSIPAAQDGDVVRYKVRVTFADGTEKRFPDNLADPFYEFYVGEVDELYCTDFASDPFAAGWTHGLTSGESSEGADDWAWGPSLAPFAAGDPDHAYSGDFVVGNDLGGEDYNGLYQAQKTNFLLSPSIDVGDYSDVRLQYRRWLNVEDGFFDQATIYSNGKLAWTNFNSDDEDGSSLHHQDREWRFHDVGLSSSIKDGAVQIKYEIASDGGLELGGWTIDDFCIVANRSAICGDGVRHGLEECDEGDANSNSDADACRTSCVAASCGDGVIDSGEACDDGNTIDGDGCEATCLLTSDEGADCGCRVGGQRGGSGPAGVLAILGFAGLLALRRRRGRHSSVGDACIR